MFGLPEETEVSKFISKNAIYTKFNFTNAQKTSFDEDIKKISIIHEISDNTLHLSGSDENSFFILEIQLKRKNYDSKNIEKLSKLIDRNLLLALTYEDEVCFAVFKTVLHQSEWQNVEDVKLTLNGHNYETIWENMVRLCGGLELNTSKALEEQIEEKVENENILKQVALLESKLRKEKQPNKKFALFEEIKKLKSELEK